MGLIDIMIKRWGQNDEISDADIKTKHQTPGQRYEELVRKYELVKNEDYDTMTIRIGQRVLDASASRVFVQWAQVYNEQVQSHNPDWVLQSLIGQIEREAHRRKIENVHLVKVVGIRE